MATAKGQERRSRLLDAAAELLVESGPDAVSHRAVAARAGLPLAATTYYFASRDDLVVQAAELLARRHLERSSTRVSAVPVRSLGPAAAARRAVEVVLPPELGAGAVLGYYERYLGAARTPALRAAVADWNAEVRRLLGQVLERTGHHADPELVLGLIDGLALTALAEGADPRRAAVRGLTRHLSA